MKKEFYHYGAEKLKEGNIPVKLLGESGEIFYEMALEMIGEIEKNNLLGAQTVLIVPVGPVGQYPIFVRLVNERRISLKNVWFFNMDEYLDDDKNYIDSSDKLSFRGFMERVVYSQIDPELVMPESQRIFPDPNDPGKCDRLIEELGGVDIAFGGIGINGHLAFNESEDVSEEEFVTRSTRVLHISDETKVANAIGDLNGAIDSMPRYAVTIGMKQIFSARKVRLGVFRDWHRSVIRRALFDEVSGAFPATIMQHHKDALIYVNANAAQIPF